MRTLSVPQPYAWLIVRGDKNVLSVPEPTDFRGEVLIYASESVSPVEVEDVKCLWSDWSTWPQSFESGRVIGKANITDCLTEETMKPEHAYWFTLRFGPYGIVFADAVAL